jgi:hypothetical protein
MDNIDNNTDNNKNQNIEKTRDVSKDKLNDLDKNLQQSKIEYDELFDMMAKRRQLLEKNK